jgi:hypothetical protein
VSRRAHHHPRLAAFALVVLGVVQAAGFVVAWVVIP